MADADREYPNQDYYPRWRVRLVIRFEEFGATSGLAAKVPSKPVKSLNGVLVPRTNLSVVPDPTAPAGSTRLLIQGKGPTPFGAGQRQVQSDDGLTQVVEGIVPAEFKWSQNGIRTADTLQAAFRLFDLPIDPRTVRSCAAEFYLGTVTAAQVAREALAGAGDGGGSATGGNSAQADAMAFLPETYTDAHGQQRTNLRFQGWVDKWSVDWSDSAEPMIRIECRDNTALFLTRHCPPALCVSATLPIDKAIAQYLTHFPEFSGLTVEYRPQGATPPVLGTVLAKTAYRPHLGPVPAHAGGGGEQLLLWDYLTDVCRAIGHGMRIEGTTLVIQRTRALTSANATARDDDPYRTRTLPSGEQLRYRRLVWGRNLYEMRCDRNFTKNAPQNVEIRSYSSDQKQLLVGRFPLPADRQTFAIPGGAGPDQKWLVLSVAGVKDEKTLRIIAQEVYENLGRSEFTWDLKTINFAAFAGGNDDPDLLDVRPGDPLEVMIARDEQASSTTTEAERDLSTQARNAQRLKQLGFADKFADRYAKTYTDGGFPTFFRVRQVDVDGSTEDGVQLSIQAVNYVEVRADKSLDPSEEVPVNAGTSPAAAPAAPPPGPGKAPKVGG